MGPKLQAPVVFAEFVVLSEEALNLSEPYRIATSSRAVWGNSRVSPEYAQETFRFGNMNKSGNSSSGVLRGELNSRITLEFMKKNKFYFFSSGAALGRWRGMEG